MDIMELSADGDLLFSDADLGMYTGVTTTDAINKGDLPDLRTNFPGWEMDLGVGTTLPNAGYVPATTVGEVPPTDGFSSELLAELDALNPLQDSWENQSLSSLDLNGLSQNSINFPLTDAMPIAGSSVTQNPIAVPFIKTEKDYNHIHVQNQDNRPFPDHTLPSVPAVTIKQELPSPTPDDSCSGYAECSADASRQQRRAGRLAENDIQQEMKKTRRKYREELSHLPVGEQRKKEKRRAQNRRAAAKCREKKKGYYDQLEMDIAEEEATNLLYQAEIDKLKRQMHEMNTFLLTHKCVMTQQQPAVMTSHYAPMTPNAPVMQTTNVTLPGDLLAACLGNMSCAPAHQNIH